jgi:hypothetical protein
MPLTVQRDSSQASRARTPDASASTSSEPIVAANGMVDQTAASSSGDGMRRNLRHMGLNATCRGKKPPAAEHGSGDSAKGT